MAGETLKKMLRPESAHVELDPAADGLAGVMAKSASVAALAELDAQLEAQSKKAHKTTPQTFIEHLPENGMYFILASEAAEQFGLMAVDPALFDAIDDVLTGELDKSTVSAARPATAVDIALCRPYFDAMLAEFSDILGELRAGKKTDIYQTAKITKDPSPHQFPEIPYLEITIAFDFENGARHGQLSLMLPAANTDFTSSLPRKGENAASWKSAFKSAIDMAPASLEVILYRKQEKIGNILRFQKGDVLEIPARALENLSIESRKGATRRKLMRARLGEYQEMRAAKITSIGAEEPDSDSPKLLEPATPPHES